MKQTLYIELEFRFDVLLNHGSHFDRIWVLFSISAIVPIEYFSDRNGSTGNVNGSKIKSINEENRV
jgi:hypothetical protein